MANLTDVGNITVNITGMLIPFSLHTAVVVVAAVNILLSITASLGNILILIGLRGITSLHPPTKLLFQCLAVTDLGVGLFSQPLYTIYNLYYPTNIKIVFILYFSSWTFSIIFCGVSMATSTALSVDRLLALLLGLRYRHVVTLKRVRVVVACCWLTAVLNVLVWAFTKKTFSIIIIFFIILFVIISLFSYTKIVLRLRQHQSRVQENVHQGQANAGGIPLNLERYKRTVVSIALMQLALVACYVPLLIYRIAQLLNSIPRSTYSLLHDLTSTLLFLNSSLNPFLYCWRIQEVRKAVKATITRFCMCLSSGTSTLANN